MISPGRPPNAFWDNAAAMKKVMADPRIQPNVNPMPFDGKRLIFGGFEVLLEA